MISSFLRKYWWFVVLLGAGIIAQIFVESHEKSITEYPTQSLNVIVEKSTYSFSGTVSGKSFTKVISNDDVSYQMPLEEKLVFNKGDKLQLSIPIGYQSAEKELIPVVSYSIIEKAKLDNIPRKN